MAKYFVRGDAVPNAEEYELAEKYSDGTYSEPLATANEINFEVSAMGLAAGEHSLVVRATTTAEGFENSDYSEPVTYTADGNVTYTVTADPTTATVKLEADGYTTVTKTGSASITVAVGTTVNWRVYANGYTTQSGTWTANGGNKTESVVLVASGGGEGTDEDNWTKLFTTDGITLETLPQSTGGTKAFTPLNKIVPANTPIQVIDLIQRENADADTVNNVQVFITNANTKTVIEQPIVDATISVITDINGTKVARVNLNKTYDVPVHIGVKGDRGGTGNLTGVNYGTLAGETGIHSFEALQIGTVVSANSDFIPWINVYSY